MVAAARPTQRPRARARPPCGRARAAGAAPSRFDRAALRESARARIRVYAVRGRGVHAGPRARQASAAAAGAYLGEARRPRGYILAFSRSIGRGRYLPPPDLPAAPRRPAEPDPLQRAAPHRNPPRRARRTSSSAACGLWGSTKMSQGDPASRTVDSDATSEQSLDDIDRRPDDTPVDAPTVRTTTRQKVAAAASARLGGRDSSASESEDEDEEVAEDVPTPLAPTPLVTLGGQLKAAADKIEKDEKMQFKLYFGTLFDVWQLFAHRDAMLELKSTCAEPYVLDSDFASAGLAPLDLASTAASSPRI